MSSSAPAVARPFTQMRLPKAVALTVIFGVAAAFVLKYVFHYYLHYSEAAFNEGAPNYWSDRGWLLLHISSGMLAVLIGPLQFSKRLRQRNLQLHRVLGRVYLVAVLLGSIGAFRMAIGTAFGWAWGFSLASMATVWATCGAMAYYAVRQRQIQVHQEWMVRTYILTFGFVSFRTLNDYGPPRSCSPTACAQLFSSGLAGRCRCWPLR